MTFSCSIIIPTFNRASFSQQISDNIKSQTYPFITEVLIGDDGSEPLDLVVPYPIRYFTLPRMSIGTKRNFLVSQATSEYVACMDTDDYYQPGFISKSIFNLIRTGKSVSGSADMIMAHGDKRYKTRCLYLDMLNEATLVFRRTFPGRFADTSAGEGRSFLDGFLEDIVETDIESLMICQVHAGNTVDKSGWLQEKYLIKGVE